jgi:hypothetical protein
VADAQDDGRPQLPVDPPVVPEWEFARWYGPMSPIHPTALTRVFDGAPFAWWVVGGWSLEADSRSPRRVHDDTDVAVPMADADAVREWMSGYQLWQTYPGHRPVLPGEPLPRNLHQMWVRRDAFSPWLMDLALTPVDGTDWVFRPDPRVRRPLSEVVRAGPDGVPYQAPEIGLLFKARHARAKDQSDLLDVLPRLDPPAREWLRDALGTVSPGHPWLDRVSALG